MQIILSVKGDTSAHTKYFGCSQPKPSQDAWSENDEAFWMMMEKCSAIVAQNIVDVVFGVSQTEPVANVHSP
jgi:hypothetical protein